MAVADTARRDRDAVVIGAKGDREVVADSGLVAVVLDEVRKVWKLLVRRLKPESAITGLDDAAH